MWEGGFNVGGEQSGHIVLRDFSTTGDGIVAALQVLGVLAQENSPASEVSHIFEPLPQIMENVRYRNGSPLSDTRVTEQIKACEARMNGSGRIIVRKSGTEPVIRVMAEGDDEKLVRSVVNELVATLRVASELLPPPDPRVFQ
jgi:phosphoglucosamine mutase